MLARALGAGPIVGTDVSPDRLLLATDLGLVDTAMNPEDATEDRLRERSDGRGFSATLDCSGNAAARHLALASTATWGRCAFVGEGGDVTFDVSPLLIHRQVTLHGSWVTSTGHMAHLLRHLDRWASPRGDRHRPLLHRPGRPRLPGRGPWHRGQGRDHIPLTPRL